MSQGRSGTTISASAPRRKMLARASEGRPTGTVARTAIVIAAAVALTTIRAVARLPGP